MEVFEFILMNGYAKSEPFEATLDEAIKECKHDSCLMCTENWLYQIIDGKYKEIGHTVLDGPFWRYVESN